MALPKEPRQKMINLMYLVLTALLALNVSSEILNAFKVVDASLQNSNSNLNAANKVLYDDLLAKVNDPKTAEKATIWNNNALKAKKLSDDMSAYIDGIKKQLKDEAGAKMVDVEGKQVEQFKEDDLEAATRLFGNGPGGKNLGPQFQQKLNDYRAQMLAIDPSFKQFEANFPVDKVDKVKGQDGQEKEFTEAYFHMTPTVAGLTLLSKFQNNVKNAENQIVRYCQSQVGAVVVHMDQVGVLVGQSSNYVMPGQEVTITAGVGAYSSAAAPKISINGSGVPVTNGQGSYKLTASGGGEHTVSVNVEFLDENGKPQTKTETVKYTVGTPGGAAVMLDKMNVFYIGVDNPITIGSPTGWDKTNVSISGGTMSGSGSNRTVRVSTPGRATITVTADGKSSTYDFRVKEIPLPTIMVGPSGGGRMQAAIFRAQPVVRADLKDFDFEAHYSIVSAEVYFNIPGDRNVNEAVLTSGSFAPAAQYMSKLVPGSTVTFDNIKVQGPDGKVKPIQNPPGFALF